MSHIPTVTSLRRQNARADRRRLSADRVVAAMRQSGLALHYSHERSGGNWRLFDGRRVSPEIAELVILNGDVVSVGDALFRDTPAQTFRIVK